MLLLLLFRAAASRLAQKVAEIQALRARQQVRQGSGSTFGYALLLARCKVLQSGYQAAVRRAAGHGPRAFLAPAPTDRPTDGPTDRPDRPTDRTDGPRITLTGFITDRI
jgi:hypothetical protein